MWDVERNQGFPPYERSRSPLVFEGVLAALWSVSLANNFGPIKFIPRFSRAFKNGHVKEFVGFVCCVSLTFAGYEKRSRASGTIIRFLAA
jgi:hypothetical protein